MKVCHVKIKTEDGMFDKPIPLKSRDVKIIERFLNELYDIDRKIISIQGFKIEDWSDDDEFGEDPSDDGERIDSLP